MLEISTYLLGLEPLANLAAIYIDVWVKVFYSTIWIDPDNEFFEFMFEGNQYRMYGREKDEVIWNSRDIDQDS